MDIIQNFNYDPDQKASIQIVDGDGGNPLTDKNGFIFAGPTYKDIFLQRLRYGTFGIGDMPNHGFIAILTSNQINNAIGRKWLALLKENGFEFIRTVDNSVYSGSSVISEPGKGCTSAHPNYVFGLFRNIGNGAIADPYTPPKAWLDLPQVVPEAWQYISESGDEQARSNGAKELNEASQAANIPLYNALPKKKFMSEAELEKDGVPVTYAGLRSKYPQEAKAYRMPKVEEENKKSPAKASPWSSPVECAPVGYELSGEPAEDYDDDFYDLDLCDCGDDDCPF